MTTQLMIRIEPDLKGSVTRLARAQGKSVSELTREVLEEYVQEHDLAAYVDRLWGRIAAQLPEEAADSEELQRMVREARKAR